ncbi:Phage P2 essential tail completion gpS-like protein [Azotobacter vinelandii CA]|uniref:Phage P2 essential tail completion gpS-like protein n=2 Tax=Azotobacter vinelandii TaxID=354 RepID=C1DS19_AZOVD|nr:phage virion morphogenesis protein [Azotobacter vinelandii]ACO79894.1 Phage P2 essential tail completion gpS-like protein [Azotobacter vinelandii DJ]AGK13972.1 Phage P2 essential tail completion gpS-like protein [Azotobacter vinelandii CA]AGK18775.1 Phage P2 essential tail completion gpS-like protein [Azotobacter vinelandii CA6]SFX44635.1 phage virion morphogenesis (putative tail completion) protein [Azotobacter vinelandii]GLK62296.1 bacteriophage tail completion protein S [Azotobacter vine
MPDDLRALEDWAGALLARLDAGERRKLTRAIARDLRRNQQQRIAAQRDPDGTPYAPRKPRKDLRGQVGRVRRRMFAKLRQAKHLKLQSTADSIAIGFVGRVARLARVHQYGLRDRVERGGPEVQYDPRQLLGLTDADLELIRDRLLEHLAG